MNHLESLLQIHVDHAWLYHVLPQTIPTTSQRTLRLRGGEPLRRFSSPRPGLHRFLTVHDDRVVLHRTAGGEKTNEVPVPGALLKARPNDQGRGCGCCLKLVDLARCWLMLVGLILWTRVQSAVDAFGLVQVEAEQL